MTAAEYGFGLSCAGAGFILGSAEQISPTAGRWLGVAVLIAGFALQMWGAP